MRLITYTKTLNDKLKESLDNGLTGNKKGTALASKVRQESEKPHSQKKDSAFAYKIVKMSRDHLLLSPSADPASGAHLMAITTFLCDQLGVEYLQYLWKTNA